MRARKGPACPRPGRQGRKRRSRRRLDSCPGPPSSRGACDSPQGGDTGWHSTCHAGEVPWLPPKHHARPTRPPAAQLCPGRAWGPKASTGGAVRPPAVPGHRPHTSGALGHAPDHCPRSGPVTPGAVPAGPTSSRERARSLEGTLVRQGTSGPRPRASGRGAGTDLRVPSSVPGKRNRSRQARPLSALALTRAHGHVLHSHDPAGPVPGGRALQRAGPGPNTTARKARPGRGPLQPSAGETLPPASRPRLATSSQAGAPASRPLSPDVPSSCPGGPRLWRSL